MHSLLAVAATFHHAVNATCSMCDSLTSRQTTSTYFAFNDSTLNLPLLKDPENVKS